MKHLVQSVISPLLIAGLIFCSCKKERSCEGCQTNPRLLSNPNDPPIAIAGADQSITLPTNSILLDGSISNDPNGSIVAWQWTKLSGPSSFNIINPGTQQTQVTNLVLGIYQFELNVTDNGGLSAKDTVQVIVKDLAQLNRPPVANAGTDQTITLSVNAVTLDGGASIDPDNNINDYAWRKLSGPSSFTLVNSNSVQAQATNLAVGVYLLELTVTDSQGLFDKDTTIVTVNNTNTNEIIFNDLFWQCWWGCWIEIPNLYNYLPSGAPFRVFIKRDNTNTWEEAFYGSQVGYGYWVENNGLLVVYGENLGNDTPDIKIVY